MPEEHKMSDKKPKTSSIDSSFPCNLPQDPALILADDAFELHIRQLLSANHEADSLQQVTNEMTIESTASQSFTLVKDNPLSASEPSLVADEVGESMDFEAVTTASVSETKPQETTFMQALATTTDSAVPDPGIDIEGKMLTENLDIAFSSTKSALVDLFQELEAVISGLRARELLELAWKEDSMATLKLIWNARSIHLGKGVRLTLYRCLGWLARNHPLTLILNLKWLHLPTIEKKASKTDSEDVVEVHTAEAMETDDKAQHPDEKWLVKNGGAHGYFKDMLNILTLRLHGKLDVLEDPRSVLNVDEKSKVKNQSRRERLDAFDKEKAQQKRHALERDRHQKVLTKLQEDPLYKALHLVVARLFARQLQSDMDLLRGDARSKSQISFAAKWAPSLERFHDKHTLIATSIAEILFPQSTLFPDWAGQTSELDHQVSRAIYLKHAREAYRAKALSPLRAQLAIVERDICSGTFDRINYSQVPSLAMNRYGTLFAQKDPERFFNYLEDVVRGKKQISGAVLVPSLVVKQALEGSSSLIPTSKSKGRNPREIAHKMQEIQAQVADAQWKSLVQRIKDSGKLRSAIAVCDVSGSMRFPQFPDGTQPMHSSLGLSLLLAEVIEPPFGGGFITFSANPRFEHVGGPDDNRSLQEKLHSMASSEWSMNTDFVAVFEKLVLPRAIEMDVAPENMVKTVFVFSDMQFDEAQSNSRYFSDQSTAQWNKSSYERVKKAYEESGYEMPELVFWNLAGGRGGYDNTEGDARVPKQATEEESGVSLVSGYSQAQLKMFMEEGVFGEEEGEEDEDEGKGNKKGKAAEAGEGVKKKKSPVEIMRKAISHPAYQMLRVYD
ncbi:MAG: hypothetical protein M1821_001383 [Bathelium mastoideum]|nr:MAG: hypothetical protein M1821_001383 [Bathelium mastoideum]